MALKIATTLQVKNLIPGINRLFELSAGKILDLEKTWDTRRGAPVFTVKGKYTSRGWTEWTQGFQFGSALLQFDATGDTQFLELGRRGTLERMAVHVSHIGVHDHGFNNIATYGNLWRLLREGKIPFNEYENNFCELALKVSGAIQAARWSRISDGGGFIYSFNGPHSLFVDTIRSLRSLAVAHQLGHVLMAEHDQRISLLDRLLQHARATARYNIFYGERRDAYDVRGRTAHEIIFNPVDSRYRCPNSQQGYSPFSTWTRGLAWAILGFAEQLEFLSRTNFTPVRKQEQKDDQDQKRDTEGDSKFTTLTSLLRAAQATGDYYIASCCADGVPVWDTGAPHLHRLGNYLDRAADPLNEWEPVDSSAAAIAAQGLLRLGNYLRSKRRVETGAHYMQAGMTIARTLLQAPYLSENPKHQGLLLHSVYHRPNGWDYVARGQNVPNGESSMWGDYHLRELAVLLLRLAKKETYPTFFA
jgi:hypothetical protein